MIITQDTINAAFEQLQNHPRYQRWYNDFQARVNLYETAKRAFNNQNGLDYFRTIYEELRRRWQVFRGARQYWNVDTTYENLCNLDQNIRFISLSNIEQESWQAIWNCIYSVREIKQTQNGPSLVAVSKFLHFWNPRLFLIFDSEVIENWVFGHNWLSMQLNSEDYNNVVHQLPDQQRDIRLCKYFSVLLFAKDLVRTNPSIVQGFHQRVQNATGHLQMQVNIGAYESLAVEQFLMGLVELPPAGVNLNG